MLLSLHVQDLAVVRQANIELGSGMTVITGETGAGKSILLDALALALGERAESMLIRPDCERAEVNAVFDITRLPAAILYLADLELTYEEAPQECIIRRVLYKNGRSKAFINGRPATTAQCRILGEHLVQIHGQHQHQLLLKEKEQCRILDAFGDHGPLLDALSKTFKAWHRLVQEKEKLILSTSQDEAKVALLRYQVNELNECNLGQNEVQQLNQEHQRLAHASEDTQAAQSFMSIISDDTDGALIDILQKAEKSLQQIKAKESALENALKIVEECQIQLHEAGKEVAHYLQGVDVNPERLHEVETRLNVVHDIARKHKVTAEKLYEHHQQLSASLEDIERLDQKLVEIDEQIANAKAHYHSVACKLTKAREKAAKLLNKEISPLLGPLGMPGGRFEVSLKSYEDDEPHTNGYEQAQFLVSTNPGHPPQALNKVASGGELSRISLAIQMITAKYLHTPTLVFDEVDVGVGGKIGAIIGQSLQKLGQKAQVLCITHLPQVAACGQQHLQVVKHRAKNNTHTEILTLDEKQRIDELARMLGGVDITKQAKANAKALLKDQKIAQDELAIQ